MAATEKGGQLDRGHGPSRLRVVNESRTNRVGNPVSYEVLVANHARLLLDPQDWPARRARFLQHDVWVTPYARGRTLCRRRICVWQQGRRRPRGLGGARSCHSQPGHRRVGKSGHAPPDASRGSPGHAAHLAFVQAAPAQFLRSKSCDRSEKRHVRGVVEVFMAALAVRSRVLVLVTVTILAFPLAVARAWAQAAPPAARIDSHPDVQAAQRLFTAWIEGQILERGLPGSPSASCPIRSWCGRRGSASPTRRRRRR